MRINLLDIIPGGPGEFLMKELEMKIRESRESMEQSLPVLQQYLQEAEAQRLRVSVLCVIVSVLIVLGVCIFFIKRYRRKNLEYSDN